MTAQRCASTQPKKRTAPPLPKNPPARCVDATAERPRASESGRASERATEKETGRHRVRACHALGETRRWAEKRGDGRCAGRRASSRAKARRGDVSVCVCEREKEREREREEAREKSGREERHGAGQPHAARQHPPKNECRWFLARDAGIRPLARPPWASSVDLSCGPLLWTLSCGPSPVDPSRGPLPWAVASHADATSTRTGSDARRAAPIQRSGAWRSGAPPLRRVAAASALRACSMGLGLAGTLGLSGWVRRLLQSPRRARCGRVRPSETVDSRTDGSRYVCKVGRMGWVGVGVG